MGAALEDRNSAEIRRFSGSWDLCVEQTSVYACAAGGVNCQSFKERKAEKVGMRERERGSW